MGKLERWIGFGVVAVAIGLLLVQLFRPSVETAAWGLSYRGEIPEGPASAQELAKYDGAYIGNTQEKVLYITFDAGYENGYTAQILDVLKKHNVPAAFFLVGNYFEKNPDLVRRMVEEGHIVGNHTTNHPDMSKISTLESFQKELTGVENLYMEITGEALPRYYRPPQGIYNEENLKMAKELGYKTLFWSLAYADWDNSRQPAPDGAVDKLLSRTHPGAVVLLHSTSKTNAEILDQLLTAWEQEGYTFAPVSQIF